MPWNGLQLGLGLQKTLQFTNHTETCLDFVSGEKYFFFNLAFKLAQGFLCKYFCTVNTDLVNKDSSLISLQSSKDVNHCKVHYAALMPQYLFADKTHHRTCAVDIRQLSCV